MIVSSPEKGLDQYPLTGKGVALATYLNPSVKIYCSDFLRTKKTADIFADVLDAKSPIQTELLRERFLASGKERALRIIKKYG